MKNSISPKVLCVGEILFDLISDEPGQKYPFVKSWTPFIGGAPANVAFGLKKLGISVGYIGRIGKDPDGETLYNFLLDKGIDTLGVQWDETAPTRKVYVERNNQGDRNFAGFGSFPSNAFADTQLEEELIPWELLSKVEFLVLGSLLMAYPKSYAFHKKLIEYCNQASRVLILDVNWRPVFWESVEQGKNIILEQIPKMDIIKFSKEEAFLLYNTDSLKQISPLLPKAKAILITDGENGCHYKIGNLMGFISAFKVKVVDTTGAGDSFLAGFIYKLLEYLEKTESFKNYLENNLGTRNILEPLDQITQFEANEIIRFASAMGALTTLEPGAINSQPSLEVTKAFLLKTGDRPFPTS